MTVSGARRPGNVTQDPPMECAVSALKPTPRRFRVPRRAVASAVESDTTVLDELHASRGSAIRSRAELLLWTSSGVTCVYRQLSVGWGLTAGWTLAACSSQASQLSPEGGPMSLPPSLNAPAAAARPLRCPAIWPGARRATRGCATHPIRPRSRRLWRSCVRLAKLPTAHACVR
jgi:hypothetical protein